MNKTTLILLSLLISTEVGAELPNFVERSLDKQIVRENGRTYTVGPRRYVHKIPIHSPERTRCQQDRHPIDKNYPVLDCWSRK